MAHDADQFATSVAQRRSPAVTAAAEEAHVALQAGKYQSAADAAVEQYEERTT